MTSRSSSRSSKAKILEAASRLFYEQGYHATGINQLITELEFRLTPTLAARLNGTV